MAKDSDTAKSSKKKNRKGEVDSVISGKSRGRKESDSNRGKSPRRDAKDNEKSPKAKSPSRRGVKKEESPNKKNMKKNKNRSDHSTRSDASSTITGENVLEVIPPEYYRNPEPMLYYLPKMVHQSERTTSSSTNGKGQLASLKFPSLRVLLQAAEDDIRLHRARIQAAKARDPSLLRSYKLETDANWLLRQQRLNERELMLSKLDTERTMILKELNSETKGLTATEKTQVQLARWQRLLELYVYTPQNSDQDLDFLGVLKNLLEGIQEVSG
jgi:hypothetical protein